MMFGLRISEGLSRDLFLKVVVVGGFILFAALAMLDDLAFLFR